MTIQTRYGTSIYVAGESHTLILPRLASSLRGAIFGHGANRPASDGANRSAPYGIIPRNMAEDRMVIYPDLGGLYNWGNDTSISRVGSARTYLISEGAPSDKIILVGASMGAVAVCNWARQNPTLVQSLILFIPAVDVEDLRANNRDGVQASIETAYTNNAGWQAARTTHNPIEYAAADLAGKGFDIKVYYSSNDPVCLPVLVESFIALVGAESHNLGAVGHDVTGLDLAEVRTWIADRD